MDTLEYPIYQPQAVYKKPNLINVQKTGSNIMLSFR